MRVEFVNPQTDSEKNKEGGLVSNVGKVVHIKTVRLHLALSYTAILVIRKKEKKPKHLNKISSVHVLAPFTNQGTHQAVYKSTPSYK